MKKPVMILALIALAGCGASEDSIKKLCAKRGFAPGSAEFQRCEREQEETNARNMQELQRRQDEMDRRREMDAMRRF